MTSSPLGFICMSLLLSTILVAEAIDIDEFTEPGSRIPNDARIMVQQLEGVHYSAQSIANLDTKAFINTYMGNLDSQHLFFILQDLEDFEQKYNLLLEGYLRQGQLSPAFAIFETYKDRMKTRLAWVFNRLNADFAFDTDETIRRDRSGSGWLASAAEADTLWNRRIKDELLVELLNAQEVRSGSDGAEKALQASIDKLRKRYQQILQQIDQIGVDTIEEEFLTSLARMYDPHSAFLSNDSLKAFAVSTTNSLVGIGAILSKVEGSITVEKLIAGGPAARSCMLKLNDKIVGVAQGQGDMVDVIGMSFARLGRLIHGEKGTMVRLLIEPGDASLSQRKEITLIRDKVKFTDTLAQAKIIEVLSDHKMYAIGVITLPEFYAGNTPGGQYSSSTTDTEELITKLKKAGVSGLVLDLRNNGGGLISEAVRLSGLFIPIGPVAQVRDKSGKIYKLYDRNPKLAWEGPLIILTSRYTSSASEIVAGALRNHRRALIVGDSATHGKGTIQAVIGLDRDKLLNSSPFAGGASKITVRKWYLPDGTSVQRKGVLSDIVIPSINESLAIGESHLENALPADTISPFKAYDEYAFKNCARLRDCIMSDELIATLRKNSDIRQTTIDEFDYLNKIIKWSEKKPETIDLNLATRRQLLEAETKFKEEMGAIRKQLSRLNYKSQDILLDIATKMKGDSRLSNIVSEARDQKTNDGTFDIHLRETLRIMSDWLTIDGPSSKQKLLSFQQR